MLKNDLEGILHRINDLSNHVISQEASYVDNEAQWPEKSMRALLQEEFGGLVATEAQGGLGQGLLGLVKFCEIISQQCASTSMCYGMHSVATAVLSAKATDYQTSNFIQPIVDGKFITTLALSEPGTGAHFYYPQSQLTSLSDNSYKIKRSIDTK